MSPASHVHEIFIRATPERVWEAITDPQVTRRYFHRTAVESTFETDAPIRYVLLDDETAVEGSIEVVEPQRRLVMTWRALYDAELAEEPPSRVEWILTPCGDAGDVEAVTRVTVRHSDLGVSPATSADVEVGWRTVLDGMKTVLETGDELGSIALPPRLPTEDVHRSWHRRQGIESNHATWGLLGRDDLETDLDAADALLASAYASMYHWRLATEPGAIERARASYTVGKAHLALGEGEAAGRHAERCASLTADAGDASDFDRAYAHELRARVFACLGDLDAAAEERRRAEAVEITDPEDRELVEGDLAAEPWFGL